MSAKPFHPGDIYSVLAGVLVSPNGIQGVVDLLSHLTDRHLHNDQIEAALTLVRPLLKDVYPSIATERFDDFRPIEKRVFIAKLEDRHGAQIEVEPIADFPKHLIEDRFEGVRKDRDDPRATAREEQLAQKNSSSPRHHTVSEKQSLNFDLFT